MPKSAGPQQGFHSNRSGLSDGGENSGQGTAGTLRSRKLLLYAKYTLPGTPACVFGGAGRGAMSGKSFLLYIGEADSRWSVGG